MTTKFNSFRGKVTTNLTCHFAECGYCPPNATIEFARRDSLDQRQGEAKVRWGLCWPDGVLSRRARLGGWEADSGDAEQRTGTVTM